MNIKMKKIVKINRICRMIEKAITEGYLYRDPNNEDNIFVYRMAGITNPEGWYSENILVTAMELCKNRREFYEFCNTIHNATKTDKYKLRFYHISGPNKGNLRKEKFFRTLQEADCEYNLRFKHHLYALNPTVWEKQEDGDYRRIEGY